MEPGGRPLTPGTSYGPPAFNSAQPFVGCSSQPSACPDVSDGLMPASCPWGLAGDEGSEQTDGADPGRSAHGRFRSSAFPSSLSWDSDSGKETPDEEELQHFSNPHGLAAHSPGSPSSGLRFDSEEEKKRRLQTRTPEEEGHEDTKTREADAPRPGSALPSDGDEKPKERRQEEAENGGGGGRSLEGKERDVYTFPGDSDPESPPPAPWAHCTFIQRCKKKRALLRPFSGLGAARHTEPEESRASLSRGAGAYEFEEAGGERDGEGGAEPGHEIFTCVECSIYFRRRVHLREHMVEHCRGAAGGGGRRAAKGGRFRCVECGWNLPGRAALAEHHRRHQESRRKILQEIEKLNENQRPTTPGTDPSPGPPPPPSPGPVTAPEADPADPSPPSSARPVSAFRRRFVCSKCNFSTRTPQALANHAKTHNRTKPAVPADPPPPGSPSSLLSTPLACGHCAFLTSSRAVLKEHQNLAHQLGPHQRSTVGGGSEAVLRPDDLTASEDGAAGREAFGRSRQTWPDSCHHELPSSEEEERDSETPRPVAGSPGAATDEGSAAASLSPRRSSKDEGDGTASHLRRSTRVAAASADSDGGEEEHVRRFLAGGVSDEDRDDSAEDEEAPRSVERKCPYCPDRFHNGIGLANHVRGHLNRVGVSYNVRHFISPEEVNAIEQKFSYQKKKKKVANFDPDTFSVMHCEFCGAGFDTRAGLSSHARAHLRDFGITNWDVTISPIHILRELFSSRPDLVLPTAPPRSLSSPQDEEEEGDEEEGERTVEVKLEGETSVSVNVSDALPSASPQRWKEEEEEEEEEGGGEEEEAAEEDDDDDDDDEELQPLSSGPGGLSGADAKVPTLKCEVCGARFETRRGLSSHARSHLRQLGVGVSESSGAPIDLLYQIAKERSGSLLDPRSARDFSPATPQRGGGLDDMDSDEKPIPFSLLAKVPPSSSSTPAPSPGASPAPPPSASPSPVVRKAPISSLLPVSSPLRSPEHKGMKGLTSHLSAAKPLWAPQESDAPLNLALDVDPDKDIVCQLCGAWFETRKGLSSHARAHLRHFGVECSESKGSPIDLLNQLIETDDFKHKAGARRPDGLADAGGLGSGAPPPKPSLLSVSSLLYKVAADAGGSTSKAAASSSLLGPPTKRLKSSPLQVFRLSGGELMAVPHNEPLKEIGCEFCGEFFENRKGLSSHARSHLRQMGITEWSVNGSPIDTLRDIITRRGLPCALPLKPLKTPPPSSPGPPRSPLSASSSPPAALLSRHPFTFARPSSPPQLTGVKSSPTPASSGGLLLKPKPEPVQLEVTAQGALGRSQGFSGDPLSCSWRTSDRVFPLNLAVAHEVEPTRDIRCEFCGEFFENRKGLSSHARSHLRQMGITEWSVNGSPIDTLREVMHKRGLGASSHLDQPVKKEAGQGAGGPPWESAGPSDGPAASGYQAAKFRKSPLGLLQAGSRLQKQGLGSGGPSAAPSGGKFFRVQLGKRPPSEEPRNFSPPSHDFSFKRRPSPDKPVHQDPSCELCGFYFENRKALASHARAHLRQFGVTEWCVNGSPIETLSAWMRSRPQKVLEMHRSYMQGSRSTFKKKASSSSSSSQWSSSLAVSLVRPLSREAGQGSSKAAESEGGAGRQAGAARPGCTGPGPPRLSGGLPLQAQVARSELNVRLPRGFERRPLKHPSCPDGTERDPPKPPRTGTIPALVPKPPSYPLVKLVGKFYTLKCRFCEVEFHGPLSVQEDWIRHLQQHILKMNYSKPAAPKAAAGNPPAPGDPPAPLGDPPVPPGDPSTPPAPGLTPTQRRPATPRSPSPMPPAEHAPVVTAAEMASAVVSGELPPPLPTQSA